MHLPFDTELAHITEIMGGIRLRMRGAKSIKQRDKMRAIKSAIALGGILRLFDREEQSLRRRV